MNRLSLLSQQISGDTSSHSLVILDQRDTVGILYLNSPKNLNALSHQMRKDIAAGLADLEARSTVKVIVILSKSPKAFCAGVDIKEFNTSEGYSRWIGKDIFQEYCSSFGSIKKPIIAGVNGIAFGGGLETALLCDILVLSDNAKIGLPEITLGLIPGIGGTQKLTRLLGKNLAMKHILTGDPIDISKIKQSGVVDVLVAENFEEEVFKIAQRIGSMSMAAILTAKMAVNASVDMSLTQGQRFERAIFYPLFSTEGTKEGVRAFIEKRKPDFTNK